MVGTAIKLEIAQSSLCRPSSALFVIGRSGALVVHAVVLVLLLGRPLAGRVAVRAHEAAKERRRECYEHDRDAPAVDDCSNRTVDTRVLIEGKLRSVAGIAALETPATMNDTAIRRVNERFCENAEVRIHVVAEEVVTQRLGSLHSRTGNGREGIRTKATAQRAQ